MAAWGFPVRDKAPRLRDDHHVCSPHLLFPGDQLSGLPRSVLVFVLHSINPPSPWQAKTTVLPTRALSTTLPSIYNPQKVPTLGLRPWHSLSLELSSYKTQRSISSSGTVVLKEWFSTSRSSIPCELVRNTNFWAPPQTLCCDKSSRGF